MVLVRGAPQRTPATLANDLVDRADEILRNPGSELTEVVRFVVNPGNGVPVRNVDGHGWILFLFRCAQSHHIGDIQPLQPAHGDRKSVVSGKSVSVRVDLGGRRIIKTKKN